jgi:hypothetical protein
VSCGNANISRHPRYYLVKIVRILCVAAIVATMVAIVVLYSRLL